MCVFFDFKKSVAIMKKGEALSFARAHHAVSDGI